MDESSVNSVSACQAWIAVICDMELYVMPT
jgi:hypothetical protein